MMKPKKSNSANAKTDQEKVPKKPNKNEMAKSVVSDDIFEDDENEGTVVDEALEEDLFSGYFKE